MSLLPTPARASACLAKGKSQVRQRARTGSGARGLELPGSVTGRTGGDLAQVRPPDAAGHQCAQREAGDEAISTVKWGPPGRRAEGGGANDLGRGLHNPTGRPPALAPGPPTPELPGAAALRTDARARLQRGLALPTWTPSPPGAWPPARARPMSAAAGLTRLGTPAGGGCATRGRGSGAGARRGGSRGARRRAISSGQRRVPPE